MEKRKKHEYLKKHIIISAVIISIVTMLSMLITILIISHSTYYKYNDSWIIGRTPEEVKARYGEFNFKSSYLVGYYIYSGSDTLSNLFRLSDNLDRYYYMYINEDGIIYKVDVGIQPGG